MFLEKQVFKKQFLEKYKKIHGKSFLQSTIQEQYNVLGKILREYIASDWIATNQKYQLSNSKQVYYFSIEFLLGRLLGNNLLNLDIHDVIQEGLKELGVDLEEIEEKESDAGLGNGGLGRLAACFLDSLASLSLPGHGMGIRYKHGFFKQKIVDGYQVELAEDWLKQGNVWEIKKPAETFEVKYGGKVEVSTVDGKLSFSWVNTEKVLAVPYDIPIVGYQNNIVNTLRLWSTETDGIADFLYPDDTHLEGKILRLKQQYFLVSASLQSIIAAYLQNGGDISQLHNKLAIHINDTHPVLAIPELMRILMDNFNLGWDEAWSITTKTISYTNHTTLSEALEKWPIYIFEPLLPRLYMIIAEINERFCHNLWLHYPGDWDRIANMAIIAHDMIKMAHLAIVGSHSVNGVAKLHTEILKQREMKLFFDFSPPKFNNKTNGINHRQWLLKANPNLAKLIRETIGENWISNPQELVNLKDYAKDPIIQEKIAKIKYQNKNKLAKFIKQETGLIINEHSIFDVQIKRLHAYKRQLLNIIHIMYLYNRLKGDSSYSITPRTFIFGAKASSAYYYAKKIIKLINTVAEKINGDQQTNELLRVVFMENYRVSLAEKIIPAADVSEQISTAGKEASGTGNMKLMMNGALTLGTLDGANIEILEAVGENNMFTFGLTSEEVMNHHQHKDYSALDYYHQDQRIRQVLDQLINGFFPAPLDEFKEIFDSLLVDNDEFFVLKDFASYIKTQERLGGIYENPKNWLEKSIINIANSGRFSSDRTINEYAKDIWRLI